jgi:TonB family protein
MGEEGRVMLRVHVGADGKPLEVTIAKSSGYARLDEIARRPSCVVGASSPPVRATRPWQALSGTHRFLPELLTPSPQFPQGTPMNENTFSLGQIWSQGDSVSHAVAIILLVMSLASWSVILIKAWSLMQLRRMSAAAKQFWHSTSFDEGMAASNRNRPTIPSVTWPAAAPKP